MKCSKCEIVKEYCEFKTREPRGCYGTHFESQWDMAKEILNIFENVSENGSLKLTILSFDEIHIFDKQTEQVAIMQGKRDFEIVEKAIKQAKEMRK